MFLRQRQKKFCGYGDLNNWFADIGNNFGGAAYNMLGWREYNEGWRTTYSANAHIRKQYCVEEDIYQSDMVKRIVLGDNSTYDHNSYFYDPEQPGKKEVFKYLADYILRIIESE
jgi:hypothetical protein